MTRSPQSIRLILVLVISCFSFASSYGQEFKILGKSMPDAFPFASIIAEGMNKNPPDSAGIKFGTYRFCVQLTARDSSDKWVLIDFRKDSELPIDNDQIHAVSITGDVSEIIDLYIRFYNKKLNKERLEDGVVAVTKDGEVYVLDSNYIGQYKGNKKRYGRISISKSDSKK
jgi:hypothetical protein